MPKSEVKVVNPLPPVTPEMIEAAKSGLAALGQSAKTSVGNFLRMNKQGVWAIGTEQEEIEADEQFVVDITSWKTGYIGWDSGKVVGEVMNLLSEGPVDESDLEPIKSTAAMDGWKPQVSFDVRSLREGEGSEPIRVAFTSKGGRSAAATLADAINHGFATHPGKAPVITLGSYSYKNKNYGNIDVFVPQYDVVDWV
jgi:hypothetical protein